MKFSSTPRVQGGIEMWRAAVGGLFGRWRGVALALCVGLGLVAEAQAQFATGGTGLHRSRIAEVARGAAYGG